jgi:hypothetical protein
MRRIRRAIGKTSKDDSQESLMIRIRIGVTTALLLLVACAPVATRAQSPCPSPPVADISSPTPPTDVCVPPDFHGNPIAFFDDYSWRAFMALVWPAKRGARGTPDATQTISAPGTRVFETYKALWEVFHSSDGSPPLEWNAQDAKNPCGATVGFDDLVLASFTKFSDLGQAGVGTLLGPLVAQNTTYVRYLTAFNKVEYDQIRSQGLYLRANLPVPPKTLKFANGSIDVKSAWVLMENLPHPERYYTRTAWVLDPQTGTCSKSTVGLVGLHIVQKTSSRPQWIWSTFEQVDTVPGDTGQSGSFTFNDGTGAAMPASNPYKISPLTLPTPNPFNVQRLRPIHESTQSTNVAYQELLAAQSSVWRFYRLVMTQWPVPPEQPSLPGTPNNTFPGAGSDATAFANTTLETFDQGNIHTGCMNCHTQTMAATDFVWSLKDHAFPQVPAELLLRDASFRALRSLMDTGTAVRAKPEAPPR